MPIALHPEKWWNFCMPEDEKKKKKKKKKKKNRTGFY